MRFSQASLLVVLSLVVCACKSKPESKESPTKDETAPSTAAVVPPAAKHLMAGADCSPTSDYALRPFCAAIELQPVLKLPKKPLTLPGVSVLVSFDQTPKEIALKTTHFSALLLDQDSVLVQLVTPDNDDEKKQLLAAAGSVMKVMRAEEKTVALPADLQGFLKSLGSKKRHKLAVTGNHATFVAKLPGAIYRSARGPAYVVFETMKSGKSYVSIFPIR